MRICVCTVVHHPADARILHRQIRAMLEAGHEVTYLAPFRDCNVAPWPDLRPVDVPRARGRRRAEALRAARRAMARHARDHDVVIVHDPELLLALPRRRRTPGRGRRPAIVWDVHEDTVAALANKPWVPRPLRPPLRPLIRAAELMAERRLCLILAEEGYRKRFRRKHPVVANTTYVPTETPIPPTDRRVVYVGHLSLARGAGEMIEVAGLLADEGIGVELIGDADADVRPMLREATRDGSLRWYGYVPNDRALRMVQGAMAGLSLLHDAPNYRHSLPTKVVEYMGRGVPVITTPTPVASEIVRTADCGVVVPYRDPRAVATAIRMLAADAESRIAMGKRGHESALARFHWPDQAREFLAQLEAWSAG